MKLLIYSALLLGVLLVPVKGTDVGKLIPVEVLAISENTGTIAVRTDTGDLGMGKTLDEAFEDLKKTAPGVIYLDTAEYVLLEPGRENELRSLERYMKKGVKVCLAEEGIPLEGIADFLSVQRPGVKLKNSQKSGKLPTITEENGRFGIK